MGGGAADLKRPALNPNWAQLQQLLKDRGGGRRRKSLHDSRGASGAPTESLLGKRNERGGSEPDEPSLSAAAVLTPVSSDCSVTDTLAMDCEMVGVGTDGSKSVLGRITLVNAWGNVVYDEFVRPLEHIVDFRTAVSGIRPRDMRKAKDFHTVQKQVAGLIKGRILVGHALRNDLKVLFLSHPKKDIRDTSEYQPFQRNEKRIALRHLAFEILGVKIQLREHCSIEDARAAMLIYQKHKVHWEKSVKLNLRLKKHTKHDRSKKLKDQNFSEPNHGRETH